MSTTVLCQMAGRGADSTGRRSSRAGGGRGGGEEGLVCRPREEPVVVEVQWSSRVVQAGRGAFGGVGRRAGGCGCSHMASRHFLDRRSLLRLAAGREGIRASGTISCKARQSHCECESACIVHPRLAVTPSLSFHPLILPQASLPELLIRFSPSLPSITLPPTIPLSRVAGLASLPPSTPPPPPPPSSILPPPSAARLFGDWLVVK